MTCRNNLHSGLLVLLAILLIGTGVASGAANLSITKQATGGPYHVGDTVLWNVSVFNDGPDDAMNITVLDEIDANGSFQTWSGEGVFNTSNGEWFIPKLENQSYANLTVGVRYSTDRQHCNRVNITLINDTAPVSEDSDLTDNNYTACLEVGRTVSATLRIKPETLNLKSRGVFTVFIDLDGIADASEPDLDTMEITCGEATLRKLILAGPGEYATGSEDEDEYGDYRIIAKFERTGLNVTKGDAVRINCTGYLTVNGETIKVEGNDTIRVIKERPVFSFMNRILAFLGLSKSDEDLSEDIEASDASDLNLLELAKNFGQQKKAMKEFGRSFDADEDESGGSTAANEEEQEPQGNGGQDEKGKGKGLEKAGKGYSAANQGNSGKPQNEKGKNSR